MLIAHADKEWRKVERKETTRRYLEPEMKRAVSGFIKSDIVGAPQQR
jgi:hypothetical protein